MMNDASLVRTPLGDIKDWDLRDLSTKVLLTWAVYLYINNFALKYHRHKRFQYLNYNN